VTPITVVLADDHHVVRKGLRALLGAEPDVSVVGEAADGLETVELVERLRPKVLVADLMMPALNGLEITRQVLRRCPDTRVVILSMYSNEAYVLEALKIGVSGYVLKGAHASDLLTAIREAAAGRHYLSPPLSEQAVAAYRERADIVDGSAHDTLTSREREVLHLAAEGRTNAEIGRRLSISPRTAETHRANLMRKLDLHAQVDLVRYAVERGLIPDDSSR
jgi:DNA-binding NarL/FixJ family response regulator